MSDELDESFVGDRLDRSVWFPYYLPHWSSRAASAATYELVEDGLRLSIAPDQPLWCGDRHLEPMQVSCLQTGSFAGPVGSTVGQQPFADGLTVTEEQPTFWGCTPLYGSLAVTMRGTIGPRSMIAFWLSGVEDAAERSGEICVAEVFGDAVADGIAQVGMGVHRFRDPALREEFATEALPVDVAAEHTYGVDWAPGSLVFHVDGHVVRELTQAPDYPVQLMLGVFAFPSRHPESGEEPAPELVVSRVVVRPL
ncbi:MAG TPA: glycoside hydrolase family 16 protein [Microlunatus sp.]|nr:glycoside hydrolase family 16 protein [Microlunatus sp.]